MSLTAGLQLPPHQPLICGLMPSVSMLLKRAWISGRVTKQPIVDDAPAVLPPMSWPVCFVRRGSSRFSHESGGQFFVVRLLSIKIDTDIVVEPRSPSAMGRSNAFRPSPKTCYVTNICSCGVAALMLGVESGRLSTFGTLA